MDSPFWKGGLWHSTRTRRTPRPSRALKDRRFTPDSCHEGVIPGYTVSIENIRFLRWGWLQCIGALAGAGWLLAVWAVGHGLDWGLIFSR